MTEIYLCDPERNPGCRRGGCFYRSHDVTMPETDQELSLITGFATVMNECCVTVSTAAAYRWPDGRLCMIPQRKAARAT